MCAPACGIVVLAGRIGALGGGLGALSIDGRVSDHRLPQLVVFVMWSWGI